MDGVLRVTTTSTPSILAFEIHSYSGHWLGTFGYDLSDVETNSAAGIAEDFEESLKAWYLEQLQAKFIASGETLQ